MKRTRLQERLGDVQLPTVATQRGGVEQDGDQVEFVGGRLAGEEEGGPDFGREAKNPSSRFHRD